MKKRLLPALLALVMVLGMLPLTAFAEDATTMPTAGDDGIIKLEQDVTLSAKYVVSKGSTVTLDLNGHKVSGATAYTIQVAGTLTIIDTSSGTPGEVNNTHNTASTIDVMSDGTLTLGGIDGGNNFIIENADDKTTKQNSAIKVEEKGTLTINGGTVKGPKTPEGNRRSIQTFGATTINAGTFEGEVQVWTWADESGTASMTIGDKTIKYYPSALTVNDGVFKDTVAICNTATAQDSYPFTGTLEIKDGTFTNESGLDDYCIGVQIPRENAEPEAGTKAEVSGGTYSAPVDPQYLADTLKFQAVDSHGIYTYHATEDAAKTAAGDSGYIGKITDDNKVEPVIKIKGTGFIWDVDDKEAIATAKAAGVTTTDDWVDQTIWVAFDQAMPNGAYYWFDVEINGTTYGIAAVGDGTHKAQAFSFLNLGQWENPPTDLVDDEGNLPASVTSANITVYKTPSQLSSAPSEDDKASYDKINDTPVSVTVPTKPTNANPNLKVENVTSDYQNYAKIKVVGMKSEYVYMIRLASTLSKDTNSVILIIDSSKMSGGTYELYCKDGQMVSVDEFVSKTALQGTYNSTTQQWESSSISFKDHTAALVTE